jgi:hypothetical protein
VLSFISKFDLHEEDAQLKKRQKSHPFTGR